MPEPESDIETEEALEELHDELPSNVTGLGVDIVQIARMETILERTESFARRVFSEAEREYCDSKPHPATHYAARFAAKEAVLKALGTGFSEGIKVTDVEVVRDDRGRPHAVLHGRAAEIAEASDVVEMHLSLSHTRETAVANAVAVTEASKVKPPEEKYDPKKELAEKFKELRGMLDELEEVAAEDDEPQTSEEEVRDERAD